MYSASSNMIGSGVLDLQTEDHGDQQHEWSHVDQQQHWTESTEPAPEADLLESSDPLKYDFDMSTSVMAKLNLCLPAGLKTHMF